MIVRLYDLGGMARLLQIRSELRRQVSGDVEVLPLCCCVEECFTQNLVEAVGVYLGFGRVERAIFLAAYQRHMCSRWVIASPTAATSQEPVPHLRQSQQK